MKPESPITSTKPLWSGDANVEASGVRFICPVCFQWVIREVFEEHVANHNNTPEPEPD
ncbi:hypothetical protein FGKAn22_14120 [Ferrigenium kumadai]|uniref:C2H2-type domain-containing protein n=1 Tax=Ferrigenium kumadai TaxID=1682490 RepID=A0AAN1T1F6_9PROT|nr:hypothetical protein FGKAn22_14120 [Ferrigenium kumadai]